MAQKHKIWVHRYLVCVRQQNTNSEEGSHGMNSTTGFGVTRAQTEREFNEWERGIQHNSIITWMKRGDQDASRRIIIIIINTKWNTNIEMQGWYPAFTSACQVAFWPLSGRWSLRRLRFGRRWLSGGRWLAWTRFVANDSPARISATARRFGGFSDCCGTDRRRRSAAASECKRRVPLRWTGSAKKVQRIVELKIYIKEFYTFDLNFQIWQNHQRQLHWRYYEAI